MINHATILERIDTRPISSPPSIRHRSLSEPCLPARLPSTAVIRREANLAAPKSLLAQLVRDASHKTDSLKEAMSTKITITDSPPQPQVPSQEFSSTSPPSPLQRIFSLARITKANEPWKDPEPWEVLRAVENKNVNYLMEVRDRAFHALVRPSGGVTPLIHAMHIGKSHHDVAIILLGAFSRYINHLDEMDFAKKETRSLLVSLRGSLKVAIDYGLQSSQSDLLASFLQTLVMSEGDTWIQEQVKLVGIALRQGPSAHPVDVARSSVKRVATRALGKAPLIADLEDYISNAAVDLLMMGAWSLALESFSGDRIPPYYFARDDRVYRVFVERLDQHRDDIDRRLSGRLKSQLATLRSALRGRARSWHVSPFPSSFYKEADFPATRAKLNCWNQILMTPDSACILHILSIVSR
ncbi:hypothetical protein B0F90DRAFT_1932148 [Multifurca ochricompacta]|uniref:Uncharacterized protein n=1 Tax=Multifurca ochricompacta TaxID=376703 RepID=A0AAD4MC02_9AGAM|nr:hypothetical protein B0F90DRAFT_1932148 [Multifurca ochricompacta]